jgi:hypothetical protein
VSGDELCRTQQLHLDTATVRVPRYQALFWVRLQRMHCSDHHFRCIALAGCAVAERWLAARMHACSIRSLPHLR